MTGYNLNQEQLAALDLNVHCAVHANAGSGKTSVLTLRFIKILLERQVPLDHIVAITFTKAAAAEMRSRIRMRLLELLTDKQRRAGLELSISDEEVCRRIRLWLRDLGSARISTFHAFCASLIRQYAFELGIDDNVRDIEENESAGYATEAVHRTLARALEPDSPLRDNLLEVLDEISVDSLEKQIKSVVRSAVRCAQYRQYFERGAETCLAERKECVEHELTRITHYVRTLIVEGLKENSGFESIVKCIDAINNTSNAGELKTVVAEWFTGKNELRKNHSCKELKQSGLVVSIPPQAVQYLELLDIEWHADREELLFKVGKLIWTLGEEAASEFRTIKRDRNCIDFDDMISIAGTMLESEDLALSVRSGISFIMVDEFQDTDPSQYELLVRLVPALDDKGAGGPNIFIVGDEKQSIYGFRDADVRLFHRATSAIQRANNRNSTDDGYRPLRMSYRMHQDLCRVVNECSGQVFSQFSGGDKKQEFDVTYQDLVPGRSHPTSPALGTLTVLLPPIVSDGDSKDVNNSQQAKKLEEYNRIASFIAEILNGTQERMIVETDRSSGNLVQRKPLPSDIAILTRSNDTVQKIVNALRERSVPFQTHGGRAFFSRPEVADLRCLLKAVANPSDDLATASLLRSPILRCSDADILAASLSVRGTTLQDGVHSLASSGSAGETMVSASALLKSLHQEVLTKPLHSLVRGVLLETRWHETLVNDSRKEQILANVDKVLDILRSTLEIPGAGIIDVLNALEPPDVDREADSMVVEQSNAVQVMTIHGSKGLEYPIVVLCGIDNRDYSPSEVWSDSIGLTLSIPTEQADPADLLSIVSLPDVASHTVNVALDIERDGAEAKRMFYVALTRAISHIVVSFSQPNPIESSSRFGHMVASGIWQSDAVSEALVLPYTPSEAKYIEPPKSSEHLIDLSAPLAPSRPQLISPSMLLSQGSPHNTDVQSRSSNTTSMEYGTAVHDALAHSIRRLNKSSSEEGIAEIIDILARNNIDRTTAMEGYNEVASVLESGLVSEYTNQLESARVEVRLVGVLSDVVLQGVLDVRFEREDGSIEVWDWKTNAVDSVDQIGLLGSSYRIQMCTYAWLCLKSFPNCPSVTTRLVFTKAITRGLAQIDAVHVWTRADMSTIEKELLEAIGSS